MKIKKFLCIFMTVVVAAVSFVVPAGAANVKPDAPSNVSAAVKSETSVKVSWDAVKNADSYIVYYSTEKKEGFESYGQTTKTSATVKGLTAGTKYYFRVKAVQKINGKKVKSDYSKAASAVPNDKPINKDEITLVQGPGDVQNGKQAILRIKGMPNTVYECVVYYDTTNGTAKGIGSVTSDSNGYAEWTWRVGTITHEGFHDIDILMNGKIKKRFSGIFKTHKKKH